MSTTCLTIRSLVLAAGMAAMATSASAQLQGPSTLQTSYMIPSAGGVQYISIASNGNSTVVPTPSATSPNETFTRLNNSPVAGNAPYRLVGIPDGMGVFQTASDVAQGRMTILCNHELGSGSGIVRDHGSRGALVSLWSVDARQTVNGAANPDFLKVYGGQDLIQRTWLWNGAPANVGGQVFQLFDNSTGGLPLYATSGGAASTWWTATGTPVANPTAAGFGRFCSADLPAPSAFLWTDPTDNTVYGTAERIFTNGEESGAAGRAFAHIASGPNAGTSWELPAHGKYSWENNVASPFPQRKTVVIGLDDSSSLGQINVWVGNKKTAATATSEVDAAGLIDGKVYTFRVTGVINENNLFALGSSSYVASAPFTLADMGDVRNTTGAAFQTLGTSLSQTNFQRPEDGGWDTVNPNRFYFLTTASVGSNSRLWQVDFTDITNPELGGTISVAFDGRNPAAVGASIVSATGATTVEMMDNMGVSKAGYVYVQEDVGGNARSGREWLFNPTTKVMTEIGRHNPARNGDNIGTVISNTAPFGQDEETSGAISAEDIIGPGWFILCDQQHYGIAGELAEGGQIMAAYVQAVIPCYANADGSSEAPILGPADFTAFLAKFRAGEVYANCDGSTAAPVLGPSDFSCFLEKFRAGCSR